MEVNRKPPSFIPLFLILVFVSVTCIGGILAAAGFQCSSDIETWVPYYPNSELVSHQYDLIPRVLGTGVTTLASPDDVETVKQFYRDHMIETLQSGRNRGLASTDWQVRENPDGDGAQIILFSSCGL